MNTISRPKIAWGSSWRGCAPPASARQPLCQRLKAAAESTGPAPPAKMTAKEKLELLLQQQVVAERATAAAVAAQAAASSRAAAGPDMRMYEMYQQMVASRDKLTQRLSETNKYVYYLEGALAEAQEALLGVDELVGNLMMELGTLGRGVEGAAAASRFAVDKEEVQEKLAKLAARFAVMEQAVSEQRQAFRQGVVRKVPVQWVGVASQVRMMGSFDNWTRGVELSAANMADDSTFKPFEGTLLLLPGKYTVKLQVDGGWRLCADWPVEHDELGEAVNVLTVK